MKNTRTISSTSRHCRAGDRRSFLVPIAAIELQLSSHSHTDRFNQPNCICNQRTGDSYSTEHLLWVPSPAYDRVRIDEERTQIATDHTDVLLALIGED